MLRIESGSFRVEQYQDTAIRREWICLPT
ncbi:hypothetical protein AL505_80044 [Escherichia coli]|nr:hypothetical protein AL505_80044 [Escherichia coli]